MVSRSSTETEYRSLPVVAAELAWIKSLLSEFHVTVPNPPKVYCDSRSVVLLAANPVLHSRTKHFEHDLYFVIKNPTKGAAGVSHSLS